MVAGKRIFSGGELIEFHLGEITGLRTCAERKIPIFHVWKFCKQFKKIV